MQKMATNQSDNRSAVLKVGQLWHTIDPPVTTDADDTEEEDDVNKDNNETMKLKREDMSLFGICPAWDQFYLVVCKHCQQVIKPQALQRHIELRHSYHNSNKLKLRTDSTNITTTTGPPMTASPLQTTIHIKEENDGFISVNGNSDSAISNEELVNNCIKSDVKVLLNSNDLKPFIDGNIVVVDNSVVDKNYVNSNELTEMSAKLKSNSKLINLLSPNMSTTLEPSLLPEPTGPGPGYRVGVVCADKNSVTISVPEINTNDTKLDMNANTCESVPVVKPPPKKKSYKKSANPRKLLPCKDRLYDPNKHCGVCTAEMERACTRSLTCKTHSLTLRRAVQGRLKNFDELLCEHREAKEAALRAQGIEIKPTKKAIQKQLRASQQLQLKEDTNHQLMSSSDTNHLQSSITQRTLVFSDSQTIDSSNMNSNVNSLLTFVSSPLTSSLENLMTRKSPQLSLQSHRKLTHNQIEVDADGSVYMCCHPRPAAVCNYNIRTYDGSRLLSRSHDLTLAALRSTFNSPLLVSKLANNQKCSSNMSQLSAKSPSRNTNQTFSSANKKLRTSIDQTFDSSSDDPTGDPYSFADAITTNSSNNYTYIKPKTSVAKNASKKRKKSDLNNCLAQNSSLLSNGQLFHPSITTKPIASNPKKKSVVKKNSQNTSISASVGLMNTNVNTSAAISTVVNNFSSVSNSTVTSNCEQLNCNLLTSLVSDTPTPPLVTHRNLNDILSNSMSDLCKSDNGSILLNGSLLTPKKPLSALSSKKTNCDIKDSIQKKMLFPTNININNNNSSKLLVNSLSPTLTSISVTPTSRPIIQKQTLPSSSVNSLSQSQNMSQISQNIHNASHTIFIKSTKQSLQN